MLMEKTINTILKAKNNQRDTPIKGKWREQLNFINLNYNFPADFKNNCVWTISPTILITKYMNCYPRAMEKWIYKLTITMKAQKRNTSLIAKDYKFQKLINHILSS